MFTYDVPLSKSFVPDHLAIFNERYRLMMKMHTEFTSLSRVDQETLWKKNMLYGTAMNMVKLESCRTGKEQWDFVYALELNDTWIGKNVEKKREWKKIDLAIANEFSGVCTESEIAYFEKLTKEIGKLVQDDETFKLLVLVLLFSDVDESPKLTNLRNTYLNVIQRRQDHINSYQQNHGSLCVGSS